jgi:hypothetical protein
MSSVFVYNEIKNFLQEQFPEDQVIDIDTIDTALRQGTGRFICLEEAISSNFISGFGDPGNICVRESSSFMVHAFVPAAESSALARQYAEDIQNSLVFRNLNGIEIDDVDPPDMEILNDGLWSTATVTLFVTYDRHVAKQ